MGLRDDEALIRVALEAAAAAPAGDVPVGAVVFGPDGTEIARAANSREATGDPTAHAEVLALRAAAQVYGDGWRLEGATLAVTLEPCTMCAGALVLSRVSRVVFGAWEPKRAPSGRCGTWCAIGASRTVRKCAVVCSKPSARPCSRRSSGNIEGRLRSCDQAISG